MFSVLGPSLPVQPMLSAPTEHHESTSPHGGSPLAESKPGDADRLPSNLPSILDMRLHEWIQKLTNPHGGAFPNGISPKQMETLAHAQWAAAIRAGRNVRPSWRGSNHLSALLSNEVRAGRLLRLQKACYIGCDPRVQVSVAPSGRFRTRLFVRHGYGRAYLASAGHIPRILLMYAMTACSSSLLQLRITASGLKVLAVGDVCSSNSNQTYAKCMLHGVWPNVILVNDLRAF